MVTLDLLFQRARKWAKKQGMFISKVNKYGKSKLSTGEEYVVEDKLIYAVLSHNDKGVISTFYCTDFIIWSLQNKIVTEEELKDR